MMNANKKAKKDNKEHVKQILKRIAPTATSTLQSALVLGMRLIAQAGTLLILSRVLNSAEFGLYSALAALSILLGSLSTFGTHLVLLQKTALTSNSREEYLNTALGTTGTHALILLVIYATIANIWLNEQHIHLLAIIFIGLSEIAVQPFVVIASFERYATGKTTTSQSILTIPIILRLAVAAIALLLPTASPLTFYSFGQLLCTLAALIISLNTAKHPWPNLERWRYLSIQELKTASGYGALNVSAIGISEIDKILAASILTLSKSGSYAAASRLVTATSLPIVALMLAITPKLLHANNQSTKRTISVIFASAATYGVFASIATWTCSTMISGTIGIDYPNINENIKLLSLSIPALCLRVCVTNTLTTLQYPWTRVALEITGCLALAILATTLPLWCQPNNYAMAIVISEWFIATAGSLILYRCIQQHHRKTGS